MISVERVAELQKELAELATLRAEIKRLQAALAVLTDCADELEGWVEAHYKDTKDYPSEMRRYERDIEPVRRARLILATSSAQLALLRQLR